MPTFEASADLRMHYLVDDFTEPWTEPETILLLHGNAESSLAWYAWVPVLARRFRVVRPDMRGYGASTPMPRDFAWTLDVIVADYTRLMEALGVQRVHLVGAKIGGVIARAFAARRPERVMTPTVVRSPPPLREGEERAGVGTGNARLAADGPGFRAAGAARQLVPRGGERRRALRPGYARFHRPARRPLISCVIGTRPAPALRGSGPRSSPRACRRASRALRGSGRHRSAAWRPRRRDR